MTTLNILKIGGGAGIDHLPALHNLAERIHRGERWIVVHGCSDLTNTLLTKRGIPVQTITSPGGHTSRYTDARTIEVFQEAAAIINNQICQTLAEGGIAARGRLDTLSGERKTAIRAIRNGRQVIIRDDYSGRITSVATHQLLDMLNAGLTPVIAPLAVGTEGEFLNVDGDLAAAAIARALAVNTFVILSNVPGLLRDVNDPASLISQFALGELNRYEVFANGRMKKKLLAAQEAHVPQMILGDARTAYPLDHAFNGAGTHIIDEGSHAALEYA
jgi:acetylglutamate/LysW-gamma-L-alpha-aminoadipate kinase